MQIQAQRLRRGKSSGYLDLLCFLFPITKQVYPYPSERHAVLAPQLLPSTPKGFPGMKRKERRPIPHNCLGKSRTPSEHGSRIGRRITIGYPCTIAMTSYQAFWERLCKRIWIPRLSSPEGKINPGSHTRKVNTGIRSFSQIWQSQHCFFFIWKACMA